jgi:carbon-monoxide dehydrogenase small subunit
VKTIEIEMSVNGQAIKHVVESRRLLCDFLRDDLFLTGTKRGCETGVCGACSVLKNGQLVKSCLSLAVQSHHAEIETIESLCGEYGQVHALQKAFMENGGLQCGYCTPGFMMATLALLRTTPNPTDEEIRDALNGNLCRCTGYSQIIDSVKAAIKS